MEHYYSIVARRWFDQKWGNTYHSVRVYRNGELVGENPYEYGYGDHYLQTADEIMKANGYHNFRQDLRENGKGFAVSCSDVSKKKDL